MKKHNQKQVAAYMKLLDGIFRPTISNGILRIAKTIHDQHGIHAAFRYLTNQAGLSIPEAHEVIKQLN